MSAPLKDVSAIKLALMARQAREQAGAILNADPIAIVGMACRVPGADTPQQLWDNLLASREAVREVPADRWDVDAWYDADPSVPARTSTRFGSFIDGISQFDAGYFGVLPREAERMDPQQRLFLEIAIEALDDAGLPRSATAGARAGVYVASYHNDYTVQQYTDLHAIDSRTLTGTLHSVLANRLSHFLDLRGPSVSIDTACSSSLVAIHLACQALRSGECDMALAGGVSLIVGPELMIAMSKVGFMSPDGRCKTFDDSADGFGRGEGCAVLVLKRLSDALAAQDRVWAVIRGSAVNQDGHSTVLAAPHGPAQEALVRSALASAQLSPGRIGFVETHGTGTALGDPIEVEALAHAIGRQGDTPCYLGSLKANIGHLEAAAGAAGVIKSVLALRHACIPPQPNFSRLNRHIDLGGSRLKIATSVQPWPSEGRSRCAGVSSFGVGGTNAHVVLEEFSSPDAVGAGEPASRRVLIPLSAKSPRSLAKHVEAWSAFLGATQARPGDLSFTAGRKRDHYPHRLAIHGTTIDELRSGLERAREAIGASSKPATGRRVGFVFSGQGPQWQGMGLELLRTQPSFRAAMEACDALFREIAGWSVLEELARAPEDSRLNETLYAQPSLFALQVGICSLLSSWGLEPDAVLGHSVGEIAALHVAGVLDLRDAVRIVWQRASVMNDVEPGGAMASVSLSVDAAEKACRRAGGGVVVAAVNGPRTTVLAGSRGALSALVLDLPIEADAKPLPVNYAFHSPLMEEASRRLADALGRVDGHAARCDVYSSVTGREVTDASFSAEYFARNVLDPVQFAPAVQALLASDVGLIVEIGPHPVLSAAMLECAVEAGVEPEIVASLRRGKDEASTLCECLARAYRAGRELDWAALAPSGGVVDLPAYAWEHRPYWLERTNRALRDSPTTRHRHPLLGPPVSVAGEDIRLFAATAESVGWKQQHVIRGEAVLPAAAIIDQFLHVACEDDARPVTLRDLTLERPVMLGTGDRGWQVVATGGRDARRLSLHQQVGEPHEWVRLCTARVAAEDPAPASTMTMVEENLAQSPAAIYQTFESLGVDFGPAFRLIDGACCSSHGARCVIQLPEEFAREAEDMAVHPVLLDAAIQLCSLTAWSEGDEPELYLPAAADVVRFWRRPGAKATAQVRVEKSADGRALRARLQLLDDTGCLALEIEGLLLTVLKGDLQTRAARSLSHTIQWVPCELPTHAIVGGQWLLVSDRGGVATRLAAALRSRGCDVHVVDDVPATLSDDLPRLCGVVYCAALDVEERDEKVLLRRPLELVQALARRPASTAMKLAFLTRGAHLVHEHEAAEGLRPAAAGLWGLADVAAIEHPELGIRLLELDPGESTIDAGRVIDAIQGSAPRIALRGGASFRPALQPLDLPAADRPTTADVIEARLTRTGTLDAVSWHTRAPRALREGEVRVRVVAAALNFRDVLLTLDLYEGEPPPLGAECSGVVVETGSGVTTLNVGDAVFGYAAGSLASEVVAPATQFVLARSIDAVPAAALPVAYLTAHYGLFTLAGLKAGESVLIHAAAGGVGLAAVHLARRCGAVVYATAGSAAKREFLHSLGIEHVFDSRSTEFATEVRRVTGGRGVDVLLNCLAGEFVQAGFRALSGGGRFLELGKRRVLTSAEAHALRPDVRYYRFDLATEIAAEPRLPGPLYRDLLIGLADGTLPLLPVTTFARDRLVDALRYMAQARHIGKIVIAVDPTLIQPSIRGTWLITGGTGGIGLRTLQRLAAMGGRRFVLLSRRGVDQDATGVLQSLRERGVDVVVERGDASDRSALLAVLDRIAASGEPLRGIVHAAGALADGVLTNQADWEAASRPLAGKSRGAWLLHDLTRSLPLDYFILYSAAGQWLGAPGQGLYPAANAELDALARYRVRCGLPALSVAWGAWDSVGMTAAVDAGSQSWTWAGMSPLDPERALDELVALMRGPGGAYAVMAMDWQRHAASSMARREPGFLDRVVRGRGSTSAAQQTGRPSHSRLDLLRDTPPAQRRDALLDLLQDLAITTLGQPAGSRLDTRAALRDLGLDSLMAVEFRNLLNRLSPSPLPATLLFDYPSLKALAAHLEEVWQLATSAPEAPDDETDIGVVASLSEEDAESQLMAELDALRAGRVS